MLEARANAAEDLFDPVAVVPERSLDRRPLIGGFRALLDSFELVAQDARCDRDPEDFPKDALLVHFESDLLLEDRAGISVVERLRRAGHEAIARALDGALALDAGSNRQSAASGEEQNEGDRPDQFFRYIERVP